MKHYFRIAILGLVAIGLVYLLARQSSLSWVSLVHAVASVPEWALLSLFALTAANLAIATLKWVLVMRALAPTTKTLFGSSFLTTTFGALMGQIMPSQIGIAIARSLAGKLGIGHSARVNFGTTIYEQIFDVIVLFTSAAISIIALEYHPGVKGWALLLFCSLLALILLTSFLLPFFLMGAARGLSFAQFRTKVKFLQSLQSALVVSARLSPSVLASLTILSVLRYVTIVGWALTALWAVGLWSYAVPAVIGLPLVVAVSLIPLTPGNIGVTEWTWSAILMSAGASVVAAGVYALVVRIINVAVLSTLLAVLILLSAVRNTPSILHWREE